MISLLLTTNLKEYMGCQLLTHMLNSLLAVMKLNIIFLLKYQLEHG